MFGIVRFGIVASVGAAAMFGLDHALTMDVDSAVEGVQLVGEQYPYATQGIAALGWMVFGAVLFRRKNVVKSKSCCSG